MKKKSIFKSVSRFMDSYDRFALESIGMDATFDEPFTRTEENVEFLLQDIQDSYEIITGFPIFVVPVTHLISVQIFGEQYFEPYPLPNGDVADDILDIRHQIELPNGVRFTDCEFYVLYPTDAENRENEVSWIVLLSCPP